METADGTNPDPLECRERVMALARALEERGLIVKTIGHSLVATNPAVTRHKYESPSLWLHADMRQEVVCRPLNDEGVLWWFWSWQGLERNSPPELEPLCPAVDIETAATRIALVVGVVRPGVPTIDLPYNPSSVRAARDWAVEVLSGILNEDVVYGINLCVSELVTNSIEHTTPTDDRKDITCKIHVKHLTATTFIHVECIDPGSARRAPRGRRAAETDEHGRGLQIVDAYADEWGYDDTVHGQRTTWFIVTVERVRDE